MHQLRCAAAGALELAVVHVAGSNIASCALRQTWNPLYCICTTRVSVWLLQADCVLDMLPPTQQQVSMRQEAQGSLNPGAALSLRLQLQPGCPADPGIISHAWGTVQGHAGRLDPAIGDSSRHNLPCLVLYWCDSCPMIALQTQPHVSTCASCYVQSFACFAMCARHARAAQAVQAKDVS